jgi:uncharacterized protein YqfB (UPF0267 family)
MYLTDTVHSTARALEGLRANRLRLVRSVAIVIGILLSMASADRSEAQYLPIKVLANKQLTDKQYQCHNEIIYRESRFNIDAVNGSHYGYYQMRSKSMQGKPYDYQFYVYWYYVAKRYGFDKSNPELPDYCSALHHLRTKGWQ